MPSLYPAPTEHDLEAVLAGLVSAPTHVARVTPEPQREPTGGIAEYVTSGDTLAAIAFADHAAVNFVGGALALVEAGTIQEVSGSSTLHEAAVDRFREIADGLGSSLNSDYTPSLHLA